MPLPTVAIIGRPNVGKSTLFNRLVGKRVVLVDAREGLTPLDEEIARWLRGHATPVVIAANKAEGNAGEAGRMEAFALGLGEPFALSAEHGEGLVDLFEAIRPHVEHEHFLTEAEEGEEGAGPLKLAIVGRPNA